MTRIDCPACGEPLGVSFERQGDEDQLTEIKATCECPDEQDGYVLYWDEVFESFLSSTQRDAEQTYEDHLNRAGG